MQKTEEFQTLALELVPGPAEVTVHLLDGRVLRGTSAVAEISRHGYPFVEDGTEHTVWLPNANLKYIILEGRGEPDVDDGGTGRRALLSFGHGEAIEVYLDDLPGSETAGFMVLCRQPATATVAPAIVCSSALVEIRFVERWGIPLDRWSATPRRRRSDPVPAAGQRGSADPASRLMQLASHYRDRLSTVQDGDLTTGDRESFTRAVRVHLERLLEEDDIQLGVTERTSLLDSIMNAAVGYGPLDQLLHDPAISEIMVNSTDDVFIERDGVLMKSDAHFEDEGQLLETIRRMIAITGRHIDELSPMVDARLPDGSRVNAIIRPAAIRGPSLTIRKFRDFVLSMPDLIREGTLSPAMGEFLRACVVGRMNILVSGGTSSGKTTTLNVLTGDVPLNQRIITVEDAAELQIQHPHVISLEQRPASIEGTGELSTRQLVRNSLRMRPDRIIVGEVRGAEALDMLQAMNTGHDGSMSTIHSNSARDGLSRLETMVMMASLDLPYEAVRAQIASAVNLLVHQARMPDGRRKIVQIAEVLGYNANGPVLKDIYVLGMGSDLHLEFNATGYRPRSLDKAAFYGVQVPDKLFDPEYARYIPAGSDSMMPVIKEPLVADGGARRSSADVVREVIVVPFSSNSEPLLAPEPGAAPALQPDFASYMDPAGLMAAATTTVAATEEQSRDVRDLVAAARHALGGMPAVPGPFPSTGGGGPAGGVAPSTAEPMFVPSWQAPPLRRKGKPTVVDARKRVQAVVDSLVAYLGLPARLTPTIYGAFYGSEIKINAYALAAKVSKTTARADLKRAASIGLVVPQRHPQLGLTYRAGSFLLQAVAQGLGLSFGEAEALTPDSVNSKIIASMAVTR